jgi:hypothetical protein
MVSEEIQRMGGQSQATQFNDDLEQAIRENGRRWGSNKDYVDAQVEQARKNPRLFYFGESDTGKRIAWIPPVREPSPPPTPGMTIPVELWKPVGVKDPFNRLIAQVQVNGHDFHAEAFQVAYDEQGVMQILEDGYDGIMREIAPDQCMKSMSIVIGPQDPQLAMRHYVVVISPHCE